MVLIGTFLQCIQRYFVCEVQVWSASQPASPFAVIMMKCVLAASSFVLVFSTGSAVHSWRTSFHSNSSTSLLQSCFQQGFQKSPHKHLNGCSLQRKGTPKECIHIYLFIYLVILGTPKVQIIFAFLGSFFSSRWVGELALGEWDRIGELVVKNNNFLTFFQRNVWKLIFWVLGFTKVYPLWIRLNLGRAPQGSHIAFYFLK